MDVIFSSSNIKPGIDVIPDVCFGGLRFSGVSPGGNGSFHFFSPEPYFPVTGQASAGHTSTYPASTSSLRRQLERSSLEDDYFPGKKSKKEGRKKKKLICARHKQEDKSEECG